MEFDVDKIRTAVQEETLLFNDEISEADVTEEFFYDTWVDDDDEKIVIDLNKLYAELLYENMTYHDKPECDMVYPEVTETYLREGLGEYLVSLILNNFIDLIEEEGSCKIFSDD